MGISKDKGGLFKYQFVNEPELNYLAQLKNSLYAYFKRMFREAGRNVQPHNPHREAIAQFRPNRVADVAKVWLHFLQPWRVASDFIVTALDLGKDAENQLMKGKDSLNMKVLTVLTHTSIASLVPPFDFFGLEGEDRR